MEHLDAMDMLREGIGLRAYGQKNPLVEYKFEAYEMFNEMIASIQEDIVTYMYRIQVVYNTEAPSAPQTDDHLHGAKESHGETVSSAEPKSGADH